jgi:hypothetical protein
MTQPNLDPRATLNAGALLLALLMLSVPAPGAEPPSEAAVNVAGRQRMLTQRIVKAYCAIGLEVLPKRARRQLSEAVATFEHQLEALAVLDLEPAAREILERVRTRWQAFAPVATGEVRRDRAGALARDADTLLNDSHRLVLQLEQAAGTPVARLVNLSGRQRMLSQRMAALYFQRAWGLGGDAVDRALELTMEEFAAGLAALSAAPQNTGTLLDELGAVNLQWTWFEYAIGLEGARSYLLVVDDSSESILNSMEAVTALYEALPTR